LFVTSSSSSSDEIHQLMEFISRVAEGEIDFDEVDDGQKM
jgi:hypothetical protein